MIRLNAVSKTFADGTSALDAVDLAIPAGSVFGIIGRSGAGKSTLLRLINGLEQPTTGQVVIEGTDLATLDPARLRLQRQSIGMIFQGFGLLAHRTVAGNIALPLELAGTAKGERTARVAELIERVGLAGRAQAYPAQLSGGQRQRVGIARALALRPTVLLSDEATSALDPETTRSILALLADLNRDAGLTIVLITHEIDVVRAVCSDIAVLDRGRLVETGPVAGVLSGPRHRATLALLGEAA